MTAAQPAPHAARHADAPDADPQADPRAAACPRCGAPLRGAPRFCPTCGHALQGPVVQLSAEALIDDPRAQAALPPELRAALRALIAALPAQPGGPWPTPRLALTGLADRGAERLLARLRAETSDLHVILTAPADEPAAQAARSAALQSAAATLAVTSALQLLGAPEAAALTEAAAAAGPLALVVLRVDACEDAADRADLEARAGRFAATLGAPLFCLDGEDDADQLRALCAWCEGQRAGAEDRLRAALRGALGSALGCLPAPTTAELAAAEQALDAAHARSLSAARGGLEAAFQQLRDEGVRGLRGMGAEARRHEGLAALERAVAAASAGAAHRYVALLLQAAAEAPELSGPERRVKLPEAGPPPPPGAPGPTGHTPPPPLPRSEGRARPSLFLAAALTTVGVLLLPGATPVAAAAGLSLIAGSLLGARWVRGRQDAALGLAQETQLLAWLDEGHRLSVADLEAEAEAWRARLRTQLRALHAAGADPGTETLRQALHQLRAERCPAPDLIAAEAAKPEDDLQEAHPNEPTSEPMSEPEPEPDAEAEPPLEGELLPGDPSPEPAEEPE